MKQLGKRFVVAQPDPISTDKDLMDGPALDLEQFLPYRLSVLSNLVSRAFARHYESAFGLSIPEWRVMAVLGRYPSISSQEVCQRTAMDKAKVSRAVTRLTASGLVSRAVNPDDQRLNVLKLSRKGRRVYQQIVPRALMLEQDLLEALAPQEAEALRGLLLRLQARVTALHPDAVPAETPD